MYVTEQNVWTPYCRILSLHLSLRYEDYLQNRQVAMEVKFKQDLQRVQDSLSFYYLI